jgi:hypothetical protein
MKSKPERKDGKTQPPPYTNYRDRRSYEQRKRWSELQDFDNERMPRR